ncbi:hypothetical protein [Desulfosporosinus sp. FKA]|uniref:hypothetical protein n=1 Tax=Desulfosporosinus sp. FKA TaxID=1969834 RepID=UPI000B49CF42|nr:hypothetical protein [Desulfosporosinus sp. FKA]
MPYQRWRQPNGDFRQDLGTLAVGILVIVVIGYFLFHGYLETSNNQSVPASNSNDVNLPNTNDLNNNSNDPNSPNYSPQISPSGNITMNIGSENNALTSGYWILYVSDGTSQQLSVTAQDYAFLQTLIQNDSKGSSSVTIFLIDNGLIHQYNISKEIYSIITNIAAIKARSSNASSNNSSSTPDSSANPSSSLSSDKPANSSADPSSDSSSSTPNTTPAKTSISETMKISNPSTSGFIVTLNPALNGLAPNNFTLQNSSGNPVSISNATTSDNGTTYTISAVLSAGQTYTFTAAYPGYTFGTPQNIEIK